MTRLIDAGALGKEMYRKSFEVDDGRNVWKSGLWIRYKIFEEAIKDAPTIEAIPINWLENFRDGLDTLSESMLMDAVDLIIEAYRVEREEE